LASTTKVIDSSGLPFSEGSEVKSFSRENFFSTILHTRGVPNFFNSKTETEEAGWKKPSRLAVHPPKTQRHRAFSRLFTKRKESKGFQFGAFGCAKALGNGWNRPRLTEEDPTQYRPLPQ